MCNNLQLSEVYKQEKAHWVFFHHTSFSNRMSERDRTRKKTRKNTMKERHMAVRTRAFISFLFKLSKRKSSLPLVRLSSSFFFSLFAVFYRNRDVCFCNDHNTIQYFNKKKVFQVLKSIQSE